MSENESQLISDVVLIDRAKHGDRQAFGVLYERYIDQIFRYVRARVDNLQTAEDLTESVFLRSFEAIGSYQDKGLRYSAYLYQVARNQVIDHYRQAEDSVSIELAEHRAAMSESIDGEIILKEQALSLRAAMERLPEEYREIIRIRVLLELSTAEAAEWMGRSEGAIRVLLHRALKALKREVRQK